MKIKEVLHSKVAQNSMWLMLLQIFNTLLPLLTLMYVTRIFSVELYGRVSLAVNWVSYAQVLVEYGFGFTATRKMSIDKTGNVQSLYSSILTARMILSILALAIISSICIISQMGMHHMICVYLMYITVIGVSLQTNWIFQGKQEMHYLTIINAAARIISFLLVFLLIKSENDFYLYCILYAGTSLLISLFSFFVVRKKFGIRFRFAKLSEAVSELKDGWYIFTSQAMSKILGGFGITVLGFLSTTESVGIYSAIQKIPITILMFFSPISQALYPHICQDYEHSFKNGVKKASKIARFIVPCFFALAMIVLLFRKQIIYIAYGEQYTLYSDLLIPLIVWMMVSIINNFLGIQILVASGHQREYSISFGISSALIVILNIIMGYQWSTAGIAIATLLSELILTIMLLGFYKKISKRQENI